MADTGAQVAQLVAVAELVLAAALTALGLYIAQQQLATNRQRLETNRQRAISEERDRQLLRQRDLFDRRWRVYSGVLTYVAGMTGDLAPETMRTSLRTLQRLTPEAHFLFGPDVRSYLKELVSHGAAFRKWRVMYRDYTQETPPGYNHEVVVAGDSEELAWFLKQYDEAPRRFEKYLRLSDE